MTARSSSGSIQLPPLFALVLAQKKPAKKAIAPKEKPALAKGQQLDQNQIAEQALAQVEAKKSELKAASYLDLIPMEYRGRVIEMADNAYPQKGQGTSRDEYREIMAQCWLGNREAFKLLVEAAGFDLLEKSDVIPSNKDSAIIALTRSGSIVALTRPDNGPRKVVYERIQARVDSNIAPKGNAPLKRDITIGGRVNVHFITSPVIAAATNKNAELADLKGAVLNMTRTHNTLMQTIWVMRERDE